MEAVYVLAHFMAPYIPDATDQIFARLNTPPTTMKKLSPQFNNLKVSLSSSLSPSHSTHNPNHTLKVGTTIDVGEVLFVKFDKKDKEKK